MSTRFLVIAAVMVVAALLCVLVPMLRSAAREGRPRTPFWLALVLALATPPLVLGVYLKIGTPQALQPAPVASQDNLAQAARELHASLEKKPDDAQGWALLAQAYASLDQPRDALDALDHLLKLKPDDADALVAQVQAKAELSPDHFIDDASRSHLEHALQIDPTYQRALWLLGISDVQRQDYAAATRHWKTLLPLLQPGSKVAAAVQREIADAESRAGGALAAAASTAPADGTATAPDAVAIHVTVNIDDQMVQRMQPDETLYVFARAIDGPPMPLAVARLDKVRFPARVTLTDAMAMSPGLRLSKFQKVRIVARLSASGNAMAQSGDLQSTPQDVATDTRTPVTLTIDRVD